MDQIKCFERKAEVNHEIQQLKTKMRDSQVLTLLRPHLLHLIIKLDHLLEYGAQWDGVGVMTVSVMHYLYANVTTCEHLTI